MHLILILGVFFACLYYCLEQWEYLQSKKRFKPDHYGPTLLPEIHLETRKRWVLCVVGFCIMTLIMGVTGRILFLAIFPFMLWCVYGWHTARLTLHLLREKRTLTKYRLNASTSLVIK